MAVLAHQAASHLSRIAAAARNTMWFSKKQLLCCMALAELMHSVRAYLTAYTHAAKQQTVHNRPF